MLEQVTAPGGTAPHVKIDGYRIAGKTGTAQFADSECKCYRGYTASPLLGTPQGLSVYMDGVRMNQAFGDVVS